jgi:hypothetical protein
MLAVLPSLLISPYDFRYDRRILRHERLVRKAVCTTLRSNNEAQTCGFQLHKPTQAASESIVRAWPRCAAPDSSPKKNENILSSFTLLFDAVRKVSSSKAGGRACLQAFSLSTNGAIREWA